MLERKKKLGKKQIKEDKLVSFYSKSLEYFEDYRNQIFIGAAAVVVIVAAIVYFSNQAQMTELEASAELAKVSNVYHSGNFQRAIDGAPQNNTPSLKTIADNYSGSESGEIARVYLADSYFYLGEYDKALEQYEDYSGDLPLYKAAATAGIGACYEAKGEPEKAGEYYRDAAFIYEQNPQNSEYLLDASINFIEANDYEEAENLLNTLKEKYGTSDEAAKADRYLAQIRLSMDS